ncbi:MAG TPA: glycosyltransferase [Candidatus Hydrogenedentes bacterium]|nr:glycosyltransferase [Candidatus Hydrogenedentota bacterium]
MKPLISIVMPCWNSVDTLPECLDSILVQSYSEWEMIAVNDGSKDRTEEVLESYAQRDSRIRVLSLAHLGIVKAPMHGVELASGEYLCRMDSDDIANPERLTRQAGYLQSNPEIALCGSRVSHTGIEAGEGRLRYFEWINAILEPEEVLRELFVECPIPHPASMMRREAFDAVGGYLDFGWAEDYDLIMRFAEAGFGMANVDAELLWWRHSEGRISMNDARYSPKQFRNLKRHYLAKMYLDSRLEYYQWGAGEVGKTWLREWGDRRPEAVVDIAPRKIGKTIHGTLVIAPDDLPKPGNGFTVVAVGAPGAREEIREWFVSRGYVECADFLFLA